MDIAEILAALADPDRRGSLTDDQITQGLEAIAARSAELATATPSQETIEELTQLTAAHEGALAETGAREAARAELEQQQATLLAGLSPTDPAPEGDDPEGDPDTGDPAPAPAPADPGTSPTPTGDPAPAPTGDPAPAAPPTSAAPVAASSRTTTRNRAPLGTATRQAPPAVPAQRSRAVASTACEIPGMPVGAALPDTDTLAQALATKLTHLGRHGGEATVARVVTQFAAPKMLQAGDYQGNLRKMREAGALAQRPDQQAITAAGGICGPLEVLYDITVFGSSRRPIRDGLVGFGASRGGIQMRPNLTVANADDYLGGIGVWTDEMDQAVGEVEDPDVPDPTKTCYRVECPDGSTAKVFARYLCLEFSNVSTRFDPEATRSHLELADIAFARVSENDLLGQLLTGSKQVTSAKLLGAVRDILAFLDKTQAYYRNRHRFDADVRLTWILPAWVRDMMRADLARQMAAGDWQLALGITTEQITAWFDRRSIDVIWHLDGRAADTGPVVDVAQQFYDDVAAGAAIPGFPNQVDGVLFASGEWLYLDGGELDLGVYRDSALTARNSYRMFREEFLGLADRSIESLRTTMVLQPTGQSAGTADTSAVAD